VPELVFPSEVQDLTELVFLSTITKIDLMYLLGIMLCPYDDVARSRIEQAVVAENVADMIREAQENFGLTHEIQVSADVALSLASAPNLCGELNDAVKGAGFGGAVSGLILGWVIFRHERSDTRSGASLRGAFRAVEKACREGRWRGGTLDNLRQNIWPAYRAAAHFWAALQVWTDKGGSLKDLETGTGHNLHLFLMMSEWFRLKGERCIPPRATAPILDPNETWKVRPEVSKEWPTFDLQCSNLDAWDLGKRIKKRPQ
jgi:hypothetical protein